MISSGELLWPPLAIRLRPAPLGRYRPLPVAGRLAALGVLRRFLFEMQLILSRIGPGIKVSSMCIG